MQVVVMRRYSDFRRVYDTARVALPLIFENLPIFPSKAFKFGMNQESIVAVNELLQVRLEAWWCIRKHREAVEFLDDSQIISSHHVDVDNWQSPVHLRRALPV